MKAPIKYLLLFVFTYCIFLVTKLPASLVMSFVDLPKGVQTSVITGTVWHSKIDQLVVNKVELTDIEVEVSALSLLTLNPSVELSFGGGSNASALSEAPRGEASLTNLLSDITVENAKVKVAAQFVAEQLNLPVPVEAHNQLNLTVDSFVIGKPYCQDLQGQLEWPRAAATAFNETVEAGALAVTLGCNSGNIEVEVAPENNLGLSFTGTLAANNRFKGNGYLQPGDKFPENLKGVLSFLGKKDPLGRYKLKI